MARNTSGKPGNSTQSKEAWYAWHLLKKGKEKRTFGNYRYNGQFYTYGSDQPCQRLVPTGVKRGEFALLHKSLVVDVPIWAVPKVHVCDVPDIGVFSTYEGDWLDDGEALHGRIQYVMLLRVNAALETADGVTGEGWTVESMKKHWRSKFDKFDAEWTIYSNTFKLHWGGWPTGYRQRLEDMIRTKVTNWQDPGAVERRNRAHARREAKKAMGL